MAVENVGLRVTAEGRDYTEEFKQLFQATTKLTKALKGLDKESDDAADGMSGAGDQAGKASGKLGRFGKAARATTKSTAAFSGSVAGLAIKFALIDRAVGAALQSIRRFGGAIKNVFQQGIQLNIELESTGVRLTSIFGSATKAKTMLDAFRKIAATTAFTIRDVSTAGATLAAFLGMQKDRTLELIKPLADLAAFMKVDMPTAAGAFGRAMAAGAGAADVLRERGVIQLVKSFNGIKDLSKLTLPEFQKALIRTMRSAETGIAGATDRISASTEGALSNLGDAWEEFQKGLTTTTLPHIDRAARKLTEILENAVKRMTGSKGIGPVFEEITKLIVENASKIENGILSITDGFERLAIQITAPATPWPP